MKNTVLLTLILFAGLIVSAQKMTSETYLKNPNIKENAQSLTTRGEHWMGNAPSNEFVMKYGNAVKYDNPKSIQTTRQRLDSIIIYEDNDPNQTRSRTIFIYNSDNTENHEIEYICNNLTNNWKTI